MMSYSIRFPQRRERPTFRIPREEEKRHIYDLIEKNNDHIARDRYEMEYD